MSCSSSHSEWVQSHAGSQFFMRHARAEPNEKNSLDLDMKAAALKVSPSVVCLVYSRAGDEKDSPEFSGTIIICEKAADEHGCGGGKYDVTVLTCAGFLSYYGVDDLKPDVNIYLAHDDICRGQVSASDAHYNIAIVKFKCEKPLQTASLSCIDDFMPVSLSCIDDFMPANPKPDNSSGGQPHLAQTNSVKLCPGDRVMALSRCRLGRLRARSGAFSVQPSRLDCQELYMTTCVGTPDHIGGPLINCDGKVIGISFFISGYTPFLPSNMVSRCLDCLLNDRHVNHPVLGMELTSFYAADLVTMEKMTQKFPDVCQGVLVTKVEENSQEYDCGIRPTDVITHCNGNPVHCSSEFFCMMWDWSGKSVKLRVVSEHVGVWNTTMTIMDGSKTERWPIPRRS